MDQPLGGMNRPSGGMDQPWGGTTQPSGGMTQPSGGMTQPSGGMNRPWGGTTRPWGGMDRPSGGTLYGEAEEGALFINQTYPSSRLGRAGSAAAVSTLEGHLRLDFASNEPATFHNR